jgi:hypothetical protein
MLRFAPATRDCASPVDQHDDANRAERQLEQQPADERRLRVARARDRGHDRGVDDPTEQDRRGGEQAILQPRCDGGRHRSRGAEQPCRRSTDKFA